MCARRHIELLRTFIMYFLCAYCSTKETKLSFSPVGTCLPKNHSKPTEAQKDDLHVCKTRKIEQSGNVVVNCGGSALLVLSGTVVFATPSPCGHRSSSLKGACWLSLRKGLDGILSGDLKLTFSIQISSFKVAILTR